LKIDDTSYDIGTVTGFYSTYRATLEDQVWWGNEGLANTFSIALGSGLGTPNVSGLYAPAFGYSIWDGSGADFMRVMAFAPNQGKAISVNAPAGNFWTVSS
jgi:hypothetical protein